MEKSYIVSFGYTNLVVPTKQQALDLLNAVPVDYDYQTKIYVPEDKDRDITVKVVDSSSIRKRSKEEDVNKTIAELTNSKDWANKESERLRKEVEELKRQLKVLISPPIQEEDSNG